MRIGDDGDDEHEMLALVHRPPLLWITLASPVYSRYPQVTEAAIVRAVVGTRKLLESMGAATAGFRFPEAIHFTYRPPSYRADYDRVFRVPLMFGSSANAIGASPALLTVALPKPFSAAVPAVVQHADAMLESLTGGACTRAQVEQILSRMFESGAPIRMQDVARRMRWSRATLARRLKREGVSFEGVLDELRRVRAVRMLPEERRSVRETARRLGFSESSAFSRAFRRWTGIAPTALSAREPSR